MQEKVKIIGWLLVDRSGDIIGKYTLGQKELAEAHSLRLNRENPYGGYPPFHVNPILETVYPLDY